MAQRFSETIGWQAFGANDVIRETQMGQHANTLYYPGVSTCTTITVSGAGGLYGAHLTIFDSVSSFGRLMERIKGAAGAITGLCFVGHLATTGDGWNLADGLDWPQQADTVRDLLGAPGVPVRYAITPGGMGVDIRVTSAGGGFACALKPQTNPFTAAGGWQNVPLTPRA